MYDFDELHPRREYLNGKSVAYWIGALCGPLPDDFRSASKLAGAMSFHYDIEEQAWDEEHIRTTPELLFDKFMPVAPVSLSEAWSPIPLICNLLGAPKYHDIDRTSDWHRPAYAVFDATFVGPFEYTPSNKHDRHAFRLLRFACARALEKEGDILIVARPGWSYEHARKSQRMNPELSDLMKKVGYYYTERVEK